ncbi:MAG: prepilin-type N-terminal cleavage/methylation domain-containing protein [Conexivisphaerales archaeon]
MQEVRRKGFTLVEMVVSMSVMLVIMIMIFSFFSFSMRYRSAVQEESIIQNNFRFAVSKMVDDIRMASSQGTQQFLIQPEENAVGNVLLVLQNESGVIYNVKYEQKETSYGTAIFRKKWQAGTSEPPEGVPVTDYMKQLIRVYYIRQGGKVVVLMVGKTTYFGKDDYFTYASLAFSRNSKFEH